MRTLLCAIPALLALAGPALAEPQQLDEAQLGGIAADRVTLHQLNTIALPRRFFRAGVRYPRGSCGAVRNSGPMALRHSPA